MVTSDSASTMQPVALGVQGLRDVYGSFPTGVTAVCALDDGAPVGIAATSFTPVSIDPPLISICIQNSSQTWPKLSRVGCVGISVLREDQELICRALAAKDGDRFADVAWHAGDDGDVLVEESLAWLTCRIVEQIAAGDHVIVLLRILTMWHRSDYAPLIFHRSRFRQLVQPTPLNPVPSWLHDRGSAPFEFD